MKTFFTILTLTAIQYLAVNQAYQERGYFATGGEWCIIPLIAFVYAFYKQIQNHNKRKNS